jgi:hypothetical protein
MISAAVLRVFAAGLWPGLEMQNLIEGEGV